MSFIIQRQPREYVTCPGAAKSYTSSLIRVRKWPTREAAEREACGNERVIDLRELVAFDLRMV